METFGNVRMNYTKLCGNLISPSLSSLSSPSLPFLPLPPSLPSPSPRVAGLQ